MFAPVQTDPGAYPASHEIATGTYLAVKRPVCGLDHHLLFSAVVNERVEYTSNPAVQLHVRL